MEEILDSDYFSTLFVYQFSKYLIDISKINIYTYLNSLNASYG